MENKIYEIEKSVVDVLLNNKEKLALLSYPARRVIYAGRSTGRWYTKSESVRREILDLYDVLNSIYGKGKGKGKEKVKNGKSVTVNKNTAESLGLSEKGISEKELREFIARLEKLLQRK